MRQPHTTIRMERARRERPTALPRALGTLIIMLAAGAWPTVVLAADTTVPTQGNAIIVFVVIILLVGSVTAGLFFASPFRRRLTDHDHGQTDSVHLETEHVDARLASAPAGSLVHDHTARATPEPAFETHAWSAPGRAPGDPRTGVAPQPAVPLQPQVAERPHFVPQQPIVPRQPVVPLPTFALPPQPFQPPPPQPAPAYQPAAQQPFQPPTQQAATPTQPYPASQTPETAPRPRAVPWSTSPPQPDVNWPTRPPTRT